MNAKNTPELYIDTLSDLKVVCTISDKNNKIITSITGISTTDNEKTFTIDIENVEYIEWDKEDDTLYINLLNGEYYLSKEDIISKLTGNEKTEILTKNLISTFCKVLISRTSTKEHIGKTLVVVQ